MATSPYNARAYVPGGASLPVAQAIQAAGRKRPISKAAGTAGQTASTLTPAQIAAMSSSEIAAYIATMTPPSSTVKVDKAAASRYAASEADKAITSAVNPYERDQEKLARQKAESLAASTNFTSALSGILTGGLEGEAGREYAKKTFGGSFLGEIQTAEGARMFLDISRDFTDQDNEILDKIKSIRDQRPDLYRELYNDFVTTELANQKAGIALAESAFEHRFKAAALLLSNAQKREARTADGGAEITYVTQPGGGVVGFDKRTGEIVYQIPGTGTSGGSKSGSTKLYGNSTSGYYTMQDGKLTPVPGYTPPGKSGAKDVTPSTASNTVQRATAAGEAALEKVTDKIWAKMPGSSAEEGTPEYAKAVAAYQAQLPKSFGSAMYRVISAIGPHLKQIGYSQTQIKRAAYEIVSAEIDPPKGYKPPRASKNVSLTSSSSLPGSEFANYTQPAPPDNVVYAAYKASKPLTDEQLVQVLQQAGFSGRGLQIAYSIAKRESNGYPLAFNPNRSTGDRSWGLFQINTLGDMIGRVRQFGLQSEMQLLDPVANARAAFRMTDGGTNWYHWGVDTGKGAYRNAPVKMLPLPRTV